MHLRQGLDQPRVLEPGSSRYGLAELLRVAAVQAFAFGKQRGTTVENVRRICLYVYIHREEMKRGEALPSRCRRR